MPQPKTKIEWAQWFVSQGFWIFPLHPSTKAGQISGSWPELLTNQPDKVNWWWLRNPDYNIGIATEKFGKDGKESLLVIDVDCKGSTDGRPIADNLIAEGVLEGSTFRQNTPSGGAHFVYRREGHLRARYKAFGPGIDVLSGRRYFLGAGSTLPGGTYTYVGGDLLCVPPRLTEECAGSNVTISESKESQISSELIDLSAAKERAKKIIETQLIGVSSEGSRNSTLYLMANRLKDTGLSLSNAFPFVKEYNLKRCQPPLGDEEVLCVVEKAFKHGQNEPGINAPENIFKDEPINPPTLDPISELNKEYAFVTSGGGHHIIHETKDESGNFFLDHLQTDSFHARFAHRTISYQRNNKIVEEQITKLWFKAASRRSYEKLVFKPGLSVDSRFYNLWRGFSYEPAESQEHPAVSQFLEHLQANICQNDHELMRWVLGYFAHLIQKPWEKVRTALVFKGRKGTGKNALVDCVGALLGQHYDVVADKRYLLGNFNSHLENCLLIVLDEAFWSGDHSANGVLKHLITGNHHKIERKGQESYRIENITRTVIIGNEDWIVPASEEERRYCVLKVGEGRIKDTKFFTSMRKGMEQGGYRHLIKYLLDYDLSGLSFDEAPDTEGLHDQKLEGLTPIAAWWYDSLKEGKLIQGSWPFWPETASKESVYEAYSLQHKHRQLGRLPTANKVTYSMRKFCPSLGVIKHRAISGEQTYLWAFPSLDVARKEWEKFINHKEDWE